MGSHMQGKPFTHTTASIVTWPLAFVAVAMSVVPHFLTVLVHLFPVHHTCTLIVLLGQHCQGRTSQLDAFAAIMGIIKQGNESFMERDIVRLNAPLQVRRMQT